MNWITKLFYKKPLENTTDDNLICPTVVWIHGANQSSLSFAYLRSICNIKKEILINYSSMEGFYNNLESMIHKIKRAGPVFLIGHSMGGIYSVHLHKNCPNVIGAVTISTPFRGSSAADWARFIVPSYPLFKDVGRRSKPIIEANNHHISIPWTQVVSTTGSVPYLKSPNDGVVTVASMRCRNDMEFIEVENTHYEVMCSDNVADIILKKYHTICSHLSEENAHIE